MALTGRPPLGFIYIFCSGSFFCFHIKDCAGMIEMNRKDVLLCQVTMVLESWYFVDAIRQP